jgi:hypothetical protein
MRTPKRAIAFLTNIFNENRRFGPRFEIRKYGDGLERASGIELRVGVTFR